MPRDMSWSDFSEILEAKRASYIAGDLRDDDMRRWLGTQGYSATEIASEMRELSAQWLAKFRQKH